MLMYAFDCLHSSQSQNQLRNLMNVVCIIGRSRSIASFMRLPIEIRRQIKVFMKYEKGFLLQIEFKMSIRLRKKAALLDICASGSVTQYRKTLFHLFIVCSYDI